MFTMSIFIVLYSRSGNQTVIFQKLPSNVTLTLGLDTFQGWVVFPSQAVYDLDNIQPNELLRSNSDLYAEFSLEHILIEGEGIVHDLHTMFITYQTLGHCIEEKASKGSSVRGIQFALEKHGLPFSEDTLVMDNLAYFQLKANPGAWSIRLREGPSEEIYDLLDQGHVKHSLDVSVSSFRGTLIRPVVRRRPGKEVSDVLNYKSRPSLWSTIKQ